MDSAYQYYISMTWDRKEATRIGIFCSQLEGRRGGKMSPQGFGRVDEGVAIKGKNA